jgi:hypothetical protein
MLAAVSEPMPGAADACPDAMVEGLRELIGKGTSETRRTIVARGLAGRFREEH